MTTTSTTSSTTDGDTSDSDTSDSDSDTSDTTDADCAGNPGCDCGEGDTCVDGYVCYEEICQEEPECGNDFVELWEQCDDGNDVENDGCNPDCTKTAVEDWTARFNGPDGNGQDEFFDAVVDPENGDVYVVGYESNIGEGTNIVMERYSFKGQKYWTRTWKTNGTDDEVGYGIGIDGDKNYFVTGSTGKDEDLQLVTIKFDPDGNEEWVRFVDNSGTDIGHDLVVTDGDDVVVVGQVGDGADLDVWVGGWFSNGSESWSDTWSGQSNGPSIGRAIDLAGSSVVVTGSILTNGQGSDIWVAKLGANLGTEAWANRVHLTDEDHGWGVAADPDGNVFVGGTTGPDEDVFIGKYDPSGDEEWTYEAPGNDFVRSLAADGVGNAVVAGFRSMGQQNDSDVWIQTIDANGELASTTIHDGPTSKDDVAWGVTFGPDGEVVIAGSEWSEANRLDGLVGRFTFEE